MRYTAVVARCALLVTALGCAGKVAPGRDSEHGAAAAAGGESGQGGKAAGAGSGEAARTGGMGGKSGGAGNAMSTGGARAQGSGGRGDAGDGAGKGGSSGTTGTAGAGQPGAGTSGGAGSGARTYSTNRDAFFGASRCNGAGLLLCDDFESGTLDTSIWKVKWPAQAPVFDSTRFARGGKSLHFHTSAVAPAGIETSHIFPVSHETYYGRMFVYFEALPTSPQWAHWTIVGANPSSSDSASIKGEVRVGGQFDGTIERFGVGTDGGPTGDWTNLDKDPSGTPSAVPNGQWICIEWMHDGENDETRFYWDGVEHPSLDTTKDVKHQGNASVKYELPTIASVWVGFWNYDQGKPTTPDHYDIWVDEFALDSQRIGCDL
jgi:hypothetical protein